MDKQRLAELIQGCQRNNRRSQEQLYRMFFPILMSMCMRYTNSREEALPIVNQGMLKVFTKIDSYQNRGSFESWVKKVVFHTLSDHFRKENKRMKLTFLDINIPTEKSSPLHQLYAEDLITLTEKLPPATQKVFQLFAIEGYTHTEISELLSISVGTSKWHLAHARKLLKEFIYKKFGDVYYAI